MKHTDIINSLSLEQKCALLSGGTVFTTRALPGKGIPAITLSDGPNGVRKQAGAADHLGLNPSVPATCFPTSATVANSWDPALGEAVGAAMGEEAAAQGVSVLLGPGLNIKRSPLCGRNFEYFSEDPYAGKNLEHYRTAQVQKVPDAEFEALLGRPIPENKVHIDRNMTLGEMGHGRSPIGWLAAAVLGALLRRSIKKGKPDLNILFQYNMPLRALAKMTNGAISMGMVDGIVMELQGFWIIGLVRVIFEAVKNLVLNSRMEERLKNS